MLKLVPRIGLELRASVRSATLNVTVVLMSVTTVSSVLLITIDVDLSVRTPVYLTSLLTQQRGLASLATPIARPALLNSSVLLAPTLSQSPSMVSVTAALILVILVAPLLLSVDHASQVSVLLVPHVSQLAPPVPTPLMESVSAELDIFPATSVSRHAHLVSALLVVSVLSVMTTALVALDRRVLALAVSVDML